ncbi:hypothetical protein G9A89_008498 [Geosiphon pyriformis]|nr:hypothetical protein G9A89_008498 [Geosiphon pyriformis]
MENSLHDWCLLEYKHVALQIPTSNFYITNLSSTACITLLQNSELKGCNFITGNIQSMGIEKEKICLLDPAAKEDLKPGDGEEFEYFLFGGILGDDPPKDRTSELRKLGFRTRHLGSLQMTTDTALLVTKRVVEDKVPLHEIPYIDYPEIKLDTTESVVSTIKFWRIIGNLFQIMPFRYIAFHHDTISTLQTTNNELKKNVFMDNFETSSSTPQSLTLPQPGEVLIHDFRPTRSIPNQSLQEETQPPALKCLQWNVERNLSASKILDTLRQLDPDIALLQEIDIECERSNRRDHFREIAKELEWKGGFVCEFVELEGKTSQERDGVHGNAIFTKHQISFRTLDHKYHPYDWERDGHKLGEPRKGRRFTLVAEVKTPHGPPILCYCVHLEVFCGLTGRIAQFSEILSDSAAHIPTHPYQIIFGDLNTMSHSIARFSPFYCTDQYRVLSCGMSESVFWDKYLFSWHTLDGDSNLLLKSCGLGYFNRFFSWGPNSNSNQQDYQHVKTLSGFTSSVLCAARNPGFYDPWDSELDITLHNPNYLGIYKAKLDWTLVRGFEVINRWMGNDDYSASDHKYLMVALLFDQPDNIQSPELAKKIWLNRREKWNFKAKSGLRVGLTFRDEKNYEIGLFGFGSRLTIIGILSLVVLGISISYSFS